MTMFSLPGRGDNRSVISFRMVAPRVHRWPTRSLYYASIADERQPRRTGVKQRRGCVARWERVDLLLVMRDLSTSISCARLVFCCFVSVTIDSRAVGYSPSGHRSLHASVPVSVGGGVPGISLDDERDSTESHQSATAAAVAAAAAVRKSCLAGSHTSAPWRPQGKLLLMLSFLTPAASTPIDSCNCRVLWVFSFWSTRLQREIIIAYYARHMHCVRGLRIRLEFARCHCITTYAVFSRQCYLSTNFNGGCSQVRYTQWRLRQNRLTVLDDIMERICWQC